MLNHHLHQQSQAQHKTMMGLFAIIFTPAINLLCLLFMIFLVAPFLIYPASTSVELPRIITSDILAERTMTISITSENIIYFRNRIVTEKELQSLLDVTDYKDQPLLIKADRRSSLARIIDVLNVCRELGFERVNITTTNR